MAQYKGIPVSQGIVIGNVCKINTQLPIPDFHNILPDQAKAERDKWADAVETVRKDLECLISAQQTEEKRTIFEAHLSILEDPFLERTVLTRISDRLENVQLALSSSVNEITAEFEALDDEYLRERVADVRDIYARILGILKGEALVDISNLQEPAIIVAQDLSPSQTACMDAENVLGFVTEMGGKTSHTSIMAQSMGIPAIVGCKELYAKVESGCEIILDSLEGCVIVNPTKEQMKRFQDKRQLFLEKKDRLALLKDLPAQTADGHRVELSSNAGSLGSILAAPDTGADGIGLFRTEFLYMERDSFPTEEEQFTVYRDAAAAMCGKPIIIRTLDIGGDKALPYYRFPTEDNPFLGYRAIRFCLDCQDVFKTQLRAILRASSFGKIRIMYPMIISLEELQSCKSLLEICKKELLLEEKTFDPKLETGIMIETPAAVIMADVLARHVDFFSIGTNDLTQYLLAVDRGNEKIQALYDSLHPAVVRSIAQVIDAAHKGGIWVGMCGELAGNLKAIPLLLGLGLDELSVSAPLLPECKDVIRESHLVHCKKIAQKVLAG